MKKKEKLVDWGEQLRKDYERWNYIFTHGGSDPFTPDGGNLNLIRNHIIGDKKKLEENPTLDMPECFYRELPPEMDYNYMARVDEITANAKAAMKIIDNDPNLKQIKEAMNVLPKNQQEQMSLPNIANYAEKLRNAIKDNDVLTMRRYEHYKRYLDSFREGVAKINALRERQEADGISVDLFDDIKPSIEWHSVTVAADNHGGRIQAVIDRGTIRSADRPADRKFATRSMEFKTRYFQSFEEAKRVRDTINTLDITTKRVRGSVTQGECQVYIRGTHVMNFHDNIMLVPKDADIDDYYGENIDGYMSDISDARMHLGLIWHASDSVNDIIFAKLGIEPDEWINGKEQSSPYDEDEDEEMEW